MCFRKIKGITMNYKFYNAENGTYLIKMLKNTLAGELAGIPLHKLLCPFLELAMLSISTHRTSFCNVPSAKRTQIIDFC